MRYKVIALACLLCVLVFVAACNNSSSENQTQGSPPATLACVPPARPPTGYVELTHSLVPQGGIEGLQILFKGPAGQHLVYTAGVLMDLFQHAPVSDGLKLASGGTASLFERGKNRWILYWTQQDACYQYTVGGDGYTRAAFMKLLYAIGLLQPK